MALWGGRFEKNADALFKALNDSLRFDWRLAPHDVRGSIAWARALGRAAVLDDDEVERLVAALREIAAEIDAIGATPPSTGDEDVHSWVEARLIERVGDLGKKLHTGRSRNDQVATDLRLYTREQLGRRIEEIRRAQAAIVELGRREPDVAMPGYTHLQRAQPVLFAHWCLAHFEALDRDAARFADAAARANLCPLGCAALAGTAYAIDRALLAEDLGFDAPTANSLDTVSDRDFVAEALAAAALCATHLSRLAEDIIIYTSEEFGFIELDDSVTSGSSIMPQKKNPDALELLRGKCGRIIGAHVALLTTLKGLPSSYNKDLQEDKEPLFDAMEHLSLCLRILPRIVSTMMLRRDRMERACADGFLNATELADYLVDRGAPFREAHETVGRIVRHAIEAGKRLEDLSLDDLRRHDPRFEPSVHRRLTIESTLARRDVLGGTAPKRVQSALIAAQERLDKNS